ncbi:2-(1,2-epoxy-1,2-dihydrophenyl)acetyl-CoA isomerase PaaG [Flavisphingomonas formosensis]|uniref:2-(1,2-epoxy-1,2-dihydrophenyl)acetyl-CoA isomerase PaaG n=1 Tax=Flavisphingomonas formosensis TaxID=861534 RepID=UPI0012FAFFCA|nr:2-(1,2-epoxy-1,2-dihydrophenyl)acetyl-CoA isomerase PaaG [Sphingomonas formosensis]
MTVVETPVLLAIQDGIARITLNRPEKLNAFSVDMHVALMAALDEAECVGARVMLLTGSGRAFCAGQDLGERDVESDAPLDLGANIDRWYNPLVRRLTDLPFPWVCAVNGVAAGAGANIALLADLTVATAGARFVQSFARIGLLPDCGGTWTLPHLVGQQRAMAMALTGMPIGAAQAAEWGLIWRAIDDADFEREVEALVTGLAAAPTRGLVETRRAIRRAVTTTLDEQLDHERDFQRLLGQTRDYREGVAAFKAKRAAHFIGE